MLAQNFKSASDLGLTDNQRDALALTLGMLERGELIHVVPSDLSPDYVDVDDNFTGHFNMDSWNLTYRECGTVCCIGGAAEIVGKLPDDSLWDACDTNEPLYRLFFPNHCTENFESITMAQAACALRNYLTTGEPNWEEALS